MATAYRKITGPNGHLAKREPFNGSTMWATGNALSLYTVYSYTSPIFKIERGGGADSS